MFGTRKVSEKFLRISKEHTLIREHLHHLDRLVTGRFGKKDLEEWKTLAPILQKDIRDHFQVEEQVLFPAALTCMPELDCFDRVLRLQKEHGHFENDLDRLGEWLAGEPVSFDAGCREFIVTLIRGLERHAREEMEELYALMDRKKTCVRLLKGAVIPD